jgi:hypothetical protein
MRKVYKYLVPFSSTQRAVAQPRAPMPGDSKIVAVGMDPETGAPAIWAEVVTDGDYDGRTRTFAAFATGAPLPSGWAHRGTAFCGTFVWHVYEQVQR